jgi:hypothetical protein
MVAVEHAVAVAELLALAKRARRDQPVAMDLGVNDLESFEQRHRAHLPDLTGHVKTGPHGIVTLAHDPAPEP